MRRAARRERWVSVGVAASLAWSAPALAQAPARCPSIEDGAPGLAERSPAERMAYLVEHTRSSREAATAWSATFAVGYLAIAAGQIGAIVATTGLEDNMNLWVGAVSSLVGVATKVVLPLAVIGDAGAIEALSPTASAGDCAALAEAEARFVRYAESEAFGASWLTHVGAVLFNVARALYLGLVHGEWLSGAIGGGIGIAVGELQILTQPTDLVGALERYRAGELDPDGGSAGTRVGATFGPTAGGGFTLSVGGAF